VKEEAWIIDREVGEALDYQAATQALLNAVVVKAAEERNAAKRMAAEEKRMAAAAKSRQAGAPAAQRQAGVKCEHGRQRSRCKECDGSICEHGRERRFCKDCGGGGLTLRRGERSLGRRLSPIPVP
jgi:DnaJ-class molecular chaperone